MISDIDLTLPDDEDPKSTLDDVLRQFKQNVKESFPNVNAEVSVTGKQLNQLIDNDFDSTITESGTEVAKLSGARFTGQVINPDGSDPQFPNQLVTKAFVDFAVGVAFPPPEPPQTYQEFLVDTSPKAYWPLQEAGPPTADDIVGTYDAEYDQETGGGLDPAGLISYQQQTLTPSEPDRDSVRIQADSFNRTYVYLFGNPIGSAPLPAFSLLASFAASSASDPGEKQTIFAVDAIVDGWPLAFQVVINDAGQVAFELETDAGFSVVTAPAVVSDGQPHQVLVVYEPGLRQDIYLDGVKTAGTPNGTPQFAPTLGRTYMGNSWRNRQGQASDMYIADIAYYDATSSDSFASIVYNKWLNG